MKQTNPQIILATSSPYRIKAFKFLNLNFIAKASNADEDSEERPNTPKELVLYLAKLKNKAVAKNYKEGIVIGFDSVGWFDEQILEKPKSKDEAFERLKSLSGKTHQFYTGIYSINIKTKEQISKIVETEVSLRNLTDSEINKYLKQDPKFNTYALGYDPLEHYSSTFVKNIKGSYNNLLRGIPLETIVEILSKTGYKI